MSKTSTTWDARRASIARRVSKSGRRVVCCACGAHGSVKLNGRRLRTVRCPRCGRRSLATLWFATDERTKVAYTRKLAEWRAILAAEPYAAEVLIRRDEKTTSGWIRNG